MVDRASTFADDEVLELLRKNYVAYAPSVTEMLKSRDSAVSLVVLGAFVRWFWTHHN